LALVARLALVALVAWALWALLPPQRAGRLALLVDLPGSWVVFLIQLCP
jgi:hypothetical protein